MATVPPAPTEEPLPDLFGGAELSDELSELITIGFCGYATALVVAYGISYLQKDSGYLFDHLQAEMRLTLISAHHIFYIFSLFQHACRFLEQILFRDGCGKLSDARPATPSRYYSRHPPFFR